MMSPRKGHLEEIFHIFAFLKSHLKNRNICFDDTYPNFDNCFPTHQVSWKDFYPNAKRNEPIDKPEPRGNPVVLTLWTDADHAGCRLTRRSHSGILIFLNRALIFWYSKRQTTVETAVYGSEYIAGKIGVDLVDGLIYKLEMFGIPIDGKVNMFIDNQAMFKSSTIPESVNKKKHTSVAFHRIREAIAAGWIRIAHVPGKTNLADFLTKTVPADDLHYACGKIFYKI